MEEELAFAVDPSQEPPVAIERGVHDVEERHFAESGQRLVQFWGPEHQEDHPAVVVGDDLADTGRLPDRGVTAIAPDEKLPFYDALLARLRGDDPDRVGVKTFRRPAVAHLHRAKRCCFLTQHPLGLILGDSCVGLGVVIGDHAPPPPRVGVLAHQVAVGGDPGIGVSIGHPARRPDLPVDVQKAKCSMVR
jgi:hypothetical protein